MTVNALVTKRSITAALFACALLLAPAAGALATVHNFSATINGANEVPANGSPATGTGTFTLDDVTNMVTYNVVFTIGLLESPETAAHIHCCSAPGVNSPVIVPLPLGTPKIGSAAITAVQATNMLAGLTYVNIHTQGRPGGEIRGQLVLVPPTATDESSWGRVKSLYR